LKSELHKRSVERLKNQGDNIESKDIDKAVNDVLNSVIDKVSKRNIEALGKVQFSAQINFSADGGLRIGEIQDIINIQPKEILNEEPDHTNNQLESLLVRMRTTKQKQLLKSNFLDLQETFILEGQTAFNRKYNSIKGLGRFTKTLLLATFKETQDRIK
tara:strand:- start:3524 stop:4000 length:477 start_codon:yes stop_codon:yes gene_type:complete